MTIYNQIASNKRKTFFIIVLFIVFFLTVSYILGKAALGYGFETAGIMLIVSGLIAFFSYYFSDKWTLSLAHAHEVKPESHKELYNALHNLTIATGMPMPKMYLINDASANAFATGRDPKHAAVAVTTGLMEKLKPAELEGVLAHELSHVKNYDTRLMGVIAILAGSIALAADIFLRSRIFGDNDRNSGPLIFVAIILAILAPIAAVLIQLSLSRKRELLADADGVLITRYPEGLAAALEKIALDKTPLKHASASTAHFYIEDPFRDKKGSWIAGLFQTHPPVEERIRILREM